MTRLSITERTLHMLEWGEFLRFYGGFVASSAARERIRSVGPVDSLEEELKLSADALRCAPKAEIPSLQGIEEIFDLIHKAGVENHVLEGIELFHIGRLSAINNETRKIITGIW